jgi:glucan biosynthesis protein C
MKRILHKTKRLHSLDSLRAIMMLLGLVIHSAITYGVINYGNAWSLKDPETTHLSNDFIVYFILSACPYSLLLQVSLELCFFMRENL